MKFVLISHVILKGKKADDISEMPGLGEILDYCYKKHTCKKEWMPYFQGKRRPSSRFSIVVFRWTYIKGIVDVFSLKGYKCHILLELPVVRYCTALVSGSGLIFLVK